MSTGHHRGVWATVGAVCVLAVALAVGSVTPAQAVDRFPDVPAGTLQNPLYPDHYVAKAADSGLTTGYPDHTFRPYTSITRDTWAYTP